MPIVNDILQYDPLYDRIEPSVEKLLDYAAELSWVDNHITIEWAMNEIRNHMTGFVRVGMVADVVRRYRKYEDAGFVSFKDWCEKALGKTQWHIIRLIDAARVVLNLAAAGFEKLPSCEAQTRPLIKYLHDGLFEMWQKVLDSLPPHRITAATIAETLDEDNPTPKKRKIAIDSDTYDAIRDKAMDAGMTVEEFLKRVVEWCDVDEMRSFDREVEEQEDDDSNEPKKSKKSRHQRWLDDLKKLIDEHDNEPNCGDSS